MSWKRIGKFFRGARQLAALFVLGMIALIAYVHFYGLPSAWKNAVLEELADRGVKLEIDSLHWDPMRGVVARGVKFKSGERGGGIQIRELALNIRMRDLIRRNLSLETLHVDGTDLQIFPDGDTKPITVEHTGGGVSL